MVSLKSVTAELRFYIGTAEIVRPKIVPIMMSFVLYLCSSVNTDIRLRPANLLQTDDLNTMYCPALSKDPKDGFVGVVLGPDYLDKKNQDNCGKLVTVTYNSTYVV